MAVEVAVSDPAGSGVPVVVFVVDALAIAAGNTTGLATGI
jgi:hypothetical protein